MSSLIERIRKARQTRVEAEGFVFLCRRPTDLEMIELQASKKVKQGDILDRFVIGWEGVKELDIVSGGDSELVEFSAELFSEWIADRPSLWSPISEVVINVDKAHQARLSESEKK